MEWGQNQLSDDGWGTTEAMHWSSDDSGSDESPLAEGADCRLYSSADCIGALQAMIPQHCKHPERIADAQQSLQLRQLGTFMLAGIQCAAPCALQGASV